MQENKQNDNRMQWIRNCEELNESNGCYDKEEGEEKFDASNAYYYTDYEIASEARITGYFDYYDSNILCSLLTSEPYKNLYSYTLRLKHPRPKPPYYNSNAKKDGYFFNRGISGELLSLFAVFFRCRFYLTAEQNIDTDIKKLPLKTLLEFHRYPCNKNIYTHLFSKQNNFNTGPTTKADNLTQFLDKVKNLDVKFHQSFILSCQHYLQALQEIGKDQEMIFIRLVSAIEAMCRIVELKAEEDPLQGKTFEAVEYCLQQQGWSRNDIDELKNIFGLRKNSKKFIHFCTKYSKGFFRGGNFKAQHLHIRKDDTKNVLKCIYKARSKYLHEGEPILSDWFGRKNWDYDPSVRRVVDNRAFNPKHKLPHDVWFEKFVRHCLLAFLSQQTKTNPL